jgi:hypothetical protein
METLSLSQIYHASNTKIDLANPTDLAAASWRMFTKHVDPNSSEAMIVKISPGCSERGNLCVHGGLLQGFGIRGEWRRESRYCGGQAHSTLGKSSKQSVGTSWDDD